MHYKAILFALVLSVLSATQARDLVIAQGIDIPGFDVHDHNTTAVEAIHVNIFDYLLMRDAQGEWQPALATSWEQVEDSAWRFMLREGVTWHDGEPFRAADVKFTLERVASDDSLREHNNYRSIREVEIINDLEVVIHTHEPDPILLNRLSRIGSSILPMHHLEVVGWQGFNDAPIGTGPFRVVEWRRDDRLIMEAFDDHWRGRPVWDTLTHRSIPEASTRVSELLTGGVHIATNIPTQDADRVNASGVAGTAPWPTPRVMLFIVNTSDEQVTGDPRVREAIEYAIDNQLLIDALMGGLGTPTRGRVTPGVSSVPMELFDDYLYDPERAVELLAEAGYAPGELTITVQGPAGRYPLDAEIAELVGVMLETVGINVELQVLEWSAYLSRIWNAFDIPNIAMIGLSNSMFDASLAISTFVCDGVYVRRTNWCDPAFDTLVEEASLEFEPERRAELMRQAFMVVAEERPMIALFQLENLAGVSNDLDWSPRPDELLWMFDAQPTN